MRRYALIAGWVLVLGLSAVLPVSAIFHGVVTLGGTVDLTQVTRSAPLVALRSRVVAPHASNGTIVIVGGSATVGGHVREDIVALGGRVYLLPGTRVTADVLDIAGTIYRGPHVDLSGQLGGAVRPWNGRSRPSAGNFGATLATSTRIGLAAGLALLLIGTLLTIVFPWQVVLISTTLRSQPFKSVAAGGLCLVTFLFLVVPLGLSLAGLPFALLLSGAGSLAWLFGITAFGVVLGRAVARGPVSLIWASAAGLVVLALGMTVPVVGPLVVTAAGLGGAGALAVALLSRSRPLAPRI